MGAFIIIVWKGKSSWLIMEDGITFITQTNSAYFEFILLSIMCV